MFWWANRNMHGNLRLWMGVYEIRVFMFLISICYPLCFPPSESPLPLPLAHPHPEGSVSRWCPSPGWADTGRCCRERWGCHSSLHPSLDPSSAAAAAAALPVAQSSLCSVTSASSEHPAAARHLQPSHECPSLSPSGWLLFFKATVFHLLA